jgi:multidrug efflux pump subunit AcrB
MVSLPGASATEVEKYLAYPIETALQSLPNVEEMTSRSSFGSLRMTLHYNAGYDDIDESIEQIRSRVNGIQWQLPEEARDIVVEQEKVDEVFHMGIALAGFQEGNPEHRLYAKKVRDEITAVPGIVRAHLAMNSQNVYIKMDADKLKRNEISIAEIRNKIRQSLSFSPIGKVDFDEKTYSVEVERPTEAIQTLNQLAIRSNSSGDILYLKDVATVGMQIDEIKDSSKFNGKPAVNIYTRKDVASDSIALKGEVLKVLENENKNLPEGLKAEVFIDTPKFIESQLSTLTNNAIFGFILVLLILTLFFNFKVSLVTSFGIPIAYCGTLIVLYLMGISIDAISVVGMILVLGILVDDAIIIAERYMENLESGMKPKQAALESSRDLMLPVTGTVLTTIFAFSPMILLDSEISAIFYGIPIVIITSLIMSWLESFFILPNHLLHFIKKAPKENSKSASLFIKTKAFYKKTLARILKFRYLAVIALIAFMSVSIWVAKNKIQQQFRSFGGNLERISVRLTLKESASLSQTEKEIVPIEKHLMTLPKDKFGKVTANVGKFWTRGRMYEGYRYAKVDLYISEDESHPGTVKREYTEKLKKELKKFETGNIEKVAVGFEMNDQDETKKDMVTIDVVGHEDVDYLGLKDALKDEIKKNKMGIEVVKDVNEFDEKWIFSPDNTMLAQHQLAQNQLTQQLRSFFVPHELMQVRIDGEAKWVYTQVERPKAISKSELNGMSVLNSRGLSVPLNKLGKWYKKKQLSQISHKDGKRTFSFDLAFNPDKDMNLIKAKEQAGQIVSVLAKKYPTFTIELRDADRAETNSRNWAARVALLCVILVMFTLALILGSVSLPLIVGLPIPFGLMGIVWALYLHDMPMGIMSLIGLVGTVGVSVNDSLIMVDQIMKRGRKMGELTRDAIIDGAASRLRAIILTSVTTLVGVFPMAYGIGGESAFTQPLAFSLGWGLFFSTFLTLFALPAFIEIRRDFGRWLTIGWDKLNKFLNRSANGSKKNETSSNGAKLPKNFIETKKDSSGSPNGKDPTIRL